MTKSTMELIQERIDKKKEDLDWMHNNQPTIYWDHIEQKQKKTDTLSELNFLGELVESMRKGVI